MQGKVDLSQSNLFKILSRIDQKYLTDFPKYKSHEGRMLVIWSAIKADQKVIQVNYEEKSAEKSKEFRSLGNSFYKKRNFRNALEFYSKSICYAPATETHDADSNLAFAYANRSAVLFHTEKYDLALLDIDRALKNGYPTKMRHKLLERRFKCLMKLCRFHLAEETLLNLKNEGGTNLLDADILVRSLKEQLENAKSERNLSNHGNMNDTLTCPIPSAPNKPSWDVSWIKGKGRHVIATECISVGDVVLADNPYASILLADKQNEFCSSCFKIVTAPVPCSQCSVSRYCSDECRIKAWASYHRTECKYLNYFSNPVGPEKYGHLGLRILLTTDDDTLEKVIQDYQMKSGIWKDDRSEDVLNDHSSDYTSVCRLETHFRERSVDESLLLAIMSGFLVKLLELESYFDKKRNPLKETDHEKRADMHKILVASLLFRHMEAVGCNAYEITQMYITKNFAECTPKDIGLGLYPMISMLNHSCNPNVDINFYKDSAIIRTIAPISVGEEIVVDYGCLYYMHQKEERQIALQTQYFFECHCEACDNNWPMEIPFDESVIPTFRCEKCQKPLPTSKKVENFRKCLNCNHQQNPLDRLAGLEGLHETYREAMDRLMKGADVQTNISALQEYLSMMHRYLCLPWRDYVSCHVALRQCYRMMANHRYES